MAAVWEDEDTGEKFHPFQLFPFYKERLTVLQEQQKTLDGLLLDVFDEQAHSNITLKGVKRTRPNEPGLGWRVIFGKPGRISNPLLRWLMGQILETYKYQLTRIFIGK